MVKSAKNLLIQYFDEDKVKYETETKKETVNSGFGNGTGIIIVAKTSQIAFLEVQTQGKLENKLKMLVEMLQKN